MKQQLTYIAFIVSLSMSPSSWATDQGKETTTAIKSNQVEVITVNARMRTEPLQEVPDSITAFSDDTIAAANIEQVNDFINLTPNITFRTGFRAGLNYITMRGITTPQQGLAPVTYVVDGVQVGALDFINQNLVDIERIEVLKGPQGALYGAGAMAGAINIITKKPTDVTEGALNMAYQSGNDMSANGVISGPLTDNLYYRLTGRYQDANGTIESRQGDDLNFNKNHQMKLRLLHEGEKLTSDFRIETANYQQGAAYQDTITSLTAKAIDDFSKKPDRGFIGQEERDFTSASVKFDYEFDTFMLTSISSYSKADQLLIGDLDFHSDAFIPGVIHGLLQDVEDNFKVKNQEIRLTSTIDGDLRWIAGIFWQDREAMQRFTVPLELLPGQIGPTADFGGGPIRRTDVKNDTTKAIFSQLNYDISDEIELTLGLRYDKVEFDSTQYQDKSLTTIVPSPSPGGTLEKTLVSEDSKIQPKISLSYQIDPDVMLYTTYAVGFRPGFYNSGNFTKSEQTKNYEIGFKSTLMDNRAIINAAIFSIDYSEQQFSIFMSEVPFRTTQNIPKTDIFGLELETTVAINDDWTFSSAVGITDATTPDGKRSPGTASYTLNLGLVYDREIAGVDWKTRFDFRRQGPMYLDINNDWYVSPKDYININTSLNFDNLSVSLFVHNILDEQQANELVQSPLVAGDYIRAFNEGRIVGIKLGYKF